MKGLYIHDIDFNLNPQYSGVKNKIAAQIKAFISLNATMDRIYLKNNIVFANNVKTKINITKYKLGRIKNNMFFKLVLKEIKETNLLDIKQYDFVYIRFSMANIGMKNLVKFLDDSGVKVIIEIPTYPYRDELKKNIYNHILIKIDNYVWNNINKYIYRIAVTTDIKEIFGVDTINIYNGVDLDNLALSKRVKEKRIINFTGIANLSKWHGYDRVIAGMKEYYSIGNFIEEVHFYIIGEGEEKVNLEKMVEACKLDEYVHFVGSKIGNELDEYMNLTDIGVSSLALFRAGGGHDPIKTKEFLGRGIPVILGYEDKLVNMELPYVIRVDEDDSAINIERIVKLYVERKWSKDEIRQYAKFNLSWEAQICKVIESLDKKRGCYEG